LAAGAAAGAIPIIIHLLNKRKFRRIWWAAMHWLWAAQKKAARRLRLEQMLLLLIRILILVLLALALAQPLLGEGQGFLAGRSDAYRLILLDNSYSMGRLVGGRPLFERAKEAAIKLVEESAPGDQVEILTVNDVRCDLIAGEALRREELLRDLRTVTLSDAGAGLPKALATACREMNRREIKNVRRELILLTDETRHAWETVGGEPRRVEKADDEEIAKAFRDSIRRPLVVIARFAGDENMENAAVTSLELDEKVAPTGVELEFVAGVRNFGRKRLENLQVVFIVQEPNGETRELDRRTIQVLEPGKDAAVRFRHTFHEAGSYALGARIPDDILPADNVAWLAVDAEKHVNVLCVDGQQRVGPNADETAFLRPALAPNVGATEAMSAGRMPLSPKVIGDGALSEQNFNDYSLIILANVRIIPSEKIPALKQWVENGGALWIWLGDRIDPLLYNRELAALLPGRIGEPVGGGDPDLPGLPIDEKRLEHPALQVFKGASGAMSLGRMEAYRRFRLLPPEDPKDAELLRPVLFGVGDELLAVEKRLGEGRVLLTAVTADTEWTNWPRRSAYMRLINALALDLIRPVTAERNRPVGESFTYRLPREELGAARRGGARLTDPFGEALLTTVDAETARIIGVPTVKAGPYRLVIPGVAGGERWCAATRGIEESDLWACPPEDISSGFVTAEGRPTLKGPFCGAVLQSDVAILPGDAALVMKALRQSVRGREIWRALVWAVVALLAAESLLARRMDNFNR
jgi:hypothetical protein